MRRLCCFFGFHRYSWVRFGHTVEMWACPCGKVIIQFAHEPRALSEVERLNAMWKQSEHVSRGK